MAKNQADFTLTFRRLSDAALDPSGEAMFNRSMAEGMAGLGMHIAAMTPDRFAEWLVGVMD